MKGPGMVVHVCDPSHITGGLSRRTEVQASPGKITRPYLKNSEKSWEPGLSGGAPA
jgi:hypothetical protein